MHCDAVAYGAVGKFLLLQVDDEVREVPPANVLDAGLPAGFLELVQRMRVAVCSLF